MEEGRVLSKMDCYDVIEQIGRGAYGATFLVLHKLEEKKYVLKKIPLTKQAEKFRRTAHQEMNLISKLQSPYIIEYKDSWVENECYVCIVTSYCEGGDMSEVIKKAKGSFLPEEKLCTWLTQLLLAVDYLHSNHVLHRDIKCSNVFLTKDGDIRLGPKSPKVTLDLQNCSRKMTSLLRSWGLPLTCARSFLRTYHMATNQIFGCCMFEIAAHQPAFRAPDLSGLVKKISLSSISPLPSVYSSALKQLVKRMLRKSPEHRPTAAELLRHPHLQPYLVKCRNLSPVFLPVKSSESSCKGRPKGTLMQDRVGARITTATNKHPKTSPSRKPGSSDAALSDQSGRDLRENGTDSSSLFEDIAEGEDGLKVKPTPKIKESRSSNSRINPISFPTASVKSKIENEKISITGQAELKNPDSLDLMFNSGPSSAASAILDETSSEAREDKGYTSKQTVGGHSHEVNRAFSELSFIRSATSRLNREEMKNDTPPKNQPRADALESLLELCASLVKQERFEELAGILRPFGDDTVSPRETAIWLTKSLMSNHKKEKAAA